MISRRVQAVDSSGIRKVFELAAKMKDPVNLSIGQPDFDIPEPLKEVAIEAIRTGQNRYTLTQGIAKLREGVRANLAATCGVAVGADEVLITSGVSGGLLLAFLALLDPGDEIIIFDPYFVMYKHLVRLVNAVPVIIDTYPSFLPDPEQVAAAITPRTKAIILNSPANPTGVVLPEALQRELVAVAAKHGLVIISDEIYRDFRYSDTPHFSPGSIYPDTITMGGFSKSHAMTGWRLGYATAPKAIMDELIKVQQYTFVCAPAPMQLAAAAALAFPMQEHFDDFGRKHRLIRDGLAPEFRISGGEGAFYLFPEVPAGCGTATEFVSEAITRKEVLVIPGNVFSERDTNFRLSFATTEATLKRGIAALCALARELRAERGAC
ncbi:MAG TPA: aminotransferase class I/II-fold pyridoxal phosphate-dependent enzyme [bacterium]|nr:aminotransferase class I/II-fold pyridoxal phosphate-dependent enzyme [bacterium]